MSQTIEVAFLPDELTVADLTGEQWHIAKAFKIDHYWNGELAPESRHTEVGMLWSDNALYVRFKAVQQEPLVLFEQADVSKKHIGLWERDVCELFIGPDAKESRRYAEFEVAPTGEWLDLMVDWTKDDPRDWEFASGLEVAAQLSVGQVMMAMRIPWGAFGGRPSEGDVWFGNLFRQVGSGETRGYLAWSPTMTDTPQYHVPEKFGEFRFVKDAASSRSER